MEKIKVKIPSEVNNYIEGLFTKDDYLRGLLFLLLSNENSSQEDVDYDNADALDLTVKFVSDWWTEDML